MSSGRWPSLSICGCCAAIENEIPFAHWWHAAGVWLFAALAAWEVGWWIGELVHGGDVWRLVGWPLLPLVLVAWLWIEVSASLGRSPVIRSAYQVAGLIPLAGFIWLWMLHANFTSRGDPAPLPYLPLLNPLDLVQIAALLALFAWFRRVRSAPFAPELFRTDGTRLHKFGQCGISLAQRSSLRTLHHWAGVPFNLDAMMRSMIVQASLSIFWSVLALCTMLTATRLRMRPLWLTGAGLMAVVVIKLFSSICPTSAASSASCLYRCWYLDAGDRLCFTGATGSGRGGKMKTLVFLLLLSQRQRLWRRATGGFCLWNADFTPTPRTRSMNSKFPRPCTVASLAPTLVMSGVQRTWRSGAACFATPGVVDQ